MNNKEEIKEEDHEETKIGMQETILPLNDTIEAHAEFEERRSSILDNDLMNEIVDEIPSDPYSYNRPASKSIKGVKVNQNLSEDEESPAKKNMKKSQEEIEKEWEELEGKLDD